MRWSWSRAGRSVVLVQTGLVPRCYLPRADVRMDLLTPTATASHGLVAFWPEKSDQLGVSVDGWRVGRG